MNGLLAQFMALLAALFAIFGTSVDGHKMPDRPAIVQSVPASTKGVLPANNSSKSALSSTTPSDDSIKSMDKNSIPNRIEMTGAIKNMKTTGGSTTLEVSNQTFIVDVKTKVTGKLEVGALVLVEATQQTNGTLLASSVQVIKVDVTVQPPDNQKPEAQSNKDDSKKDDGKTDNKDSSSGDKSGTSGSGDDKSGGDSKGKGGGK